MEEPEAVCGFSLPLAAKDDYALDLWKKHGLGANPSFEQMEEAAKKLLADHATVLEGASMMLCRRVDAKEVAEILFLAMSGDAEGAFGVLLLQYELEKMTAPR